ncbi:hypothetical protein AOE01nite_11280 [Acetobacter oeni]|uniref:Uncharacterized protein n=1 Tax=Acetobacter oeni TaxID=304077 RepID=A0A511XIY0_9PROT|nr:hypothetical protein AA21952_2064 [Acetobacter oeni LMG 21952]GEN62904.1 hypothetical protein AOE01nite_11280 [Acetobacter oeni]
MSGHFNAQSARTFGSLCPDRKKEADSCQQGRSPDSPKNIETSPGLTEEWQQSSGPDQSVYSDVKKQSALKYAPEHIRSG